MQTNVEQSEIYHLITIVADSEETYLARMKERWQKSGLPLYHLNSCQLQTTK